MSLEDRFDNLLDTLAHHPLIVKAEFLSRLISDDEGYARLVVRFINGNELHISECLTQGRVKKYAYHLQDNEGKLISPSCSKECH